jgi:hypothetical protein
VPTLLGITIVVFLLVHLAPGSPGLAGAGSLRRTTGRAAEEMRRLYGLDRPLPERFAKWMSRVARFDLGESFVDHRPVSERIREALPNTLLLNGSALLLALLIAVPLGVIAGGNPEGGFDRVSAAALFALYSMPTFWAALLLQTLLRSAALAAAHGVASIRAGGRRGPARPSRAPRAPGDLPDVRHACARRAPVRSGVAEARAGDLSSPPAPPRVAAAGAVGPRLPQRPGPALTLAGPMLPALLSERHRRADLRLAGPRPAYATRSCRGTTRSSWRCRSSRPW